MIIPWHSRSILMKSNSTRIYSRNILSITIKYLTILTLHLTITYPNLSQPAVSGKFPSTTDSRFTTQRDLIWMCFTYTRCYLLHWRGNKIDMRLRDTMEEHITRASICSRLPDDNIIIYFYRKISTSLASVLPVTYRSQTWSAINWRPDNRIVV